MKCFIDWLVEKETQVDDLPFEMSREDVIQWVKRIHTNILSEGKKPYDGRHYGDCTGQKHSCEFCLYQLWLEDYQQYCRTFKE